MRRLWVLLGLSVTMLVQTNDAQADWHSMTSKWHAFWDRVDVDWHRNNAWPKPFTSVDREAVRAPLAVMVDNGWRLQNTITTELFDVETNTLTRAGELRVRWILTQMPVHRRSLFVLRGGSDEVTQTRLKSVQAAAGSVLGQDANAMIAVTDTIPRGGSGNYYERVNRGYESSVPAPRLPELDTSGSGSN